MKLISLIALGLLIFLPMQSGCAQTAPAAPAATPASPYQKWSHGFSTDPGFFPIAVWLQQPANAERFKAVGINTFVGLWDGPTEEQLALLKKAGVRVVCEQNEVALKHLDDPTIVAWMHGDEPDNAQELPDNKGYGPPVTPQKIIDEYAQIVKVDPTRPVMLNLGQGVAWNEYYGRGTRSGHGEDYPEYMKGADIASFDIYPVVHESPKVRGKLWYVAQGVDRLTGWAGGQKVVWDCIECTHIGDPNRKATPQQVRCEVWMSLVHGSQGLIYFVHQFAPNFREAALLDDKEMSAAVTAINQQIMSLAPVLNSPTVKGFVEVKTDDPKVPVDVMVKQYQGSTYIFAVGMRDGTTKATFSVSGQPGPVKSWSVVDVLDEKRSVPVAAGIFTDTFAPWDVHIYKVGWVKP